jgi:hypothetical protein
MKISPVLQSCAKSNLASACEIMLAFTIFQEPHFDLNISTYKDHAMGACHLRSRPETVRGQHRHPDGGPQADNVGCLEHGDVNVLIASWQLRRRHNTWLIKLRIFFVPWRKWLTNDCLMLRVPENKEYQHGHVTAHPFESRCNGLLTRSRHSQ